MIRHGKTSSGAQRWDCGGNPGPDDGQEGATASPSAETHRIVHNSRFQLLRLRNEV